MKRLEKKKAIMNLFGDKDINLMELGLAGSPKTETGS